MMNRIKFSHNWNNKLDNNIFTTIRRYTDEKRRYYNAQVGKPFISILNDKEHSICELLGTEVRILKDLTEGLVCVDTGQTYEEALKTFKKFNCSRDTEVIILTFKRIKPLQPTKSSLMNAVIKEMTI